MSKIIMDAHRIPTNEINETKKIAYIKEIDGIKYLFVNGKKVNQYTNTLNKVVLTTITATERPDLNIKPLEIQIT